MKGTLIGERLTDDMADYVYLIQVSKEELMKHDNLPVLGDEVSIDEVK